MLRHKKMVFMGVVLAGLWMSFPLSCIALEIEAISTPSRDIMLSFVMTGRISEMMVKEGDYVKEGDILCKLDDRTESIRVLELKAAAADTSKIAVASAELDQKRIDLEKLESAHEKGAVTKRELEHAKLDVKIAELTLRAAELEHEQNGRQLEQAVSQIERMRLVSPISGRVEKVLATAGESTRALDPIIQLIQVNPLWIETPVPVDQIRAFTKGQRVQVQFPMTSPGEKVTARVVHISSVVDAASETQQVRLEVSNPKERPAGERITVRFGEDSISKKQAKQHPVDKNSEGLTILPPAISKTRHP